MFVFVFLRSICEMNLEAELFTLQDSNSKLVAALHEANANVEQWKKQLVAYQEETERLREQVFSAMEGTLKMLCLSSLILDPEFSII